MREILVLGLSLTLAGSSFAKSDQRSDISRAQPALAAPSAPQGPASHSDYITGPDWEVRPTGDDLFGLYPRRAAKAGKVGRAVMSCTVRADGTLEMCTIVSEVPADWGFGEATLKTARFFRMRPRLVTGASVEGAKVLIPLSWRLAN